jgi:hypothetical protein
LWGIDGNGVGKSYRLGKRWVMIGSRWRKTCGQVLRKAKKEIHN